MVVVDVAAVVRRARMWWNIKLRQTVSCVLSSALDIAFTSNDG